MIAIPSGNYNRFAVSTIRPAAVMITMSRRKYPPVERPSASFILHLCADISLSPVTRLHGMSAALVDVRL